MYEDNEVKLQRIMYEDNVYKLNKTIYKYTVCIKF